METAGLHQLRFYPVEAPTTVDTEYLDNTTRELFGLPLSNFTKLENMILNKRKYRTGYTYENKIILLVGDFTKRHPITIEINGGAFDHACINVDKISRIIEKEYTISAIHAKIDTDTTNFSQLFKAYQLDSVTSDSLKRSDRQSKTRTITFGKDPEYSIYEAGLYHPELQNKNIARHEVKFAGNNAQQFFTLWRRDPDNLATLIKSFIVGAFNVSFKDFTSTDSNLSRRDELPIWESWLLSVAPMHFDRVAPTPPRIENQLKTWTTKILQLRINLGDDNFLKILTNVDKLYKHTSEPTLQEVQLDLPL